MSSVLIHTDPDMLAELKALAKGVLAIEQKFDQIMRAKGDRLNREEFARFLGVHRHTLRRRLETDRTMPRPGKDGKWLLSEVLEWQERQG